MTSLSRAAQLLAKGGSASSLVCKLHGPFESRLLAVLSGRGYATSVSAQEQEDEERKQPMVDPMDLEFDRFNGNIAPDVPNTSEEGKPDIPLDRPVDLDPEFDRDDNPAVDVDTLYAQKEPRDEADEALDNKNSFEHYEDQDMMRFSHTSSSHRY